MEDEEFDCCAVSVVPSTSGAGSSEEAEEAEAYAAEVDGCEEQRLSWRCCSFSVGGLI